MTEYNLILEFDETDMEEVGDDLIECFLHVHPAVTMSELDRVQVIITVEADDLWHASEMARSLIGGLSIVSLQVMPTEDFDLIAERTPFPAQLSVTQTAFELRVTRTRVQQLIASRDLVAEKVGKTWVISAESVARRKTASEQAVSS